MKGKKLSELTWEEARDAINEESIVVLPISGGTKEHGPHLPCGADLMVVEELGNRVVSSFPVILLPALAYGYYPAFVDWPGSVSISPDHFMGVTGDIIRSIAKFGVKKFLIIDGGVSTHPPMRILSSELHNELGLRLAVTNILGLGDEVRKEITEQEFGGHGDELETSCILAIRPDLVKMEKAVEDKNFQFPGTRGEGGVVKIHVSGKMVSKSGVNGNATLATPEKGEKLLQAMTDDIVEFLQYFSKIKV